MHCKWRKQELKESLYFIEVKVVAGHVIHSLCLSSWSELFTFQVLKRHFRSKKRIPAKKGGLFVALSEAKQHICTKYRKNTADYPLSGGIQVCINIIRRRYCSYLVILRTKITPLCSYFWKHHVRNRFERSSTNSGIFI